VSWFSQSKLVLTWCFPVSGDSDSLIPSHLSNLTKQHYTAKTVAEMLSAVSFLHSRHICHRDLKLENWVDLWSLGVIVYILLSGAPPFYGGNDEAIKASIARGTYTFPHELFRDVSDDALDFVSCLLSYSIEYRYTAEQALTHPWLKANSDHEHLQNCKDGARGVVAIHGVVPI